MRTLVAAEVDPLTCGRDPGQQRRHELLRLADERVDRAVVILVGVHVEQLGVRGERRADRVDRAPVAALGEVRDGFERQEHAAIVRA